MNEDVKLIYQTGGKRQPEDPELKFKLSADLSPPEFMRVTFVMLHGGAEEIRLQGRTKEALDPLVGELRTNPRLRRMWITHPDGTEEELVKR